MMLQRPPSRIPHSWPSSPTLGALMDVCDENYLLVRRLAPDLPNLRGSLVTPGEAGIELCLEVMEQTKFTSLIQLTYLLALEQGPRRAPDVVMRVYHDSRQVEVLDIRDGSGGQISAHTAPTLDHKWKANLFLSKWLAYCLRQGHRFAAERSVCEPGRPIETTT